MPTDCPDENFFKTKKGPPDDIVPNPGPPDGSSGVNAFVFAAPGARADDHETKEAWRLFVADHTQPVVRAIDFADGKELGRYDIKGYAALTVSASGQTVFAAQSEQDIVHLIKTGIGFSEHGEHRDRGRSPTLRFFPWRLEGKRPAHVVPHDDHAIIFYDRGGKAEIVDEAALLEGKKAQVRAIDTTKPHHGVAITMGQPRSRLGAEHGNRAEAGRSCRRVVGLRVDRRERASRSARSANAPTCMARPYRPASSPSAARKGY